jgi:uncharacterized metal-binding protein
MKIGVVSCSGEDCLGGTISRLATQKMLDEVRPEDTVTICLPLYLAGGEEERGFAQIFPTITVDGCSKQCARRATEKYSGKVSASLDVADVIGKENAEAESLSTRKLTDVHREMVDKVTQKIKEKFDSIVIDYNKKMIDEFEKSGKNLEGGCGCGCSK